MNKANARLLFASIALYGLSPSSYAVQPVHIGTSQSSKCLSATVYKQEDVHFFKLHANFSYKTAALVVKRYPITSWHTCVYSIGLYGYDVLGGWIPLWSKDLSGNGLLFYDGFWHNQNVAFDISLDAIDLNPDNYVPSNRYQQLLISYRAQTDKNTKSYIAIYSFGNTRAFYSHLVLSFVDDGNLDYTITNHALTITGCFHTCAHLSSVTLRYDQVVHQFAIVNPNDNNEAFLRFIHRYEFTNAPYIP